jgi:hypothetical protein
MGLLQRWDSIPTDLDPRWCGFWIMTILTPLTSLCLPSAADPIVVQFLHVYLGARGKLRNLILDSFCETGSLSFPTGIPTVEDLGASYDNNVAKPVAPILARRRIDRPYETADALVSRQCHIGKELLQTLQHIAGEKKKFDDITECDILDALKTKLVNELDMFPNTIDLSYTLREVKKNQKQTATIEGLTQCINEFNI